MLTLSPEERAVLERAAQSAREMRLWRRLRALQLLADGSTYAEVARVLGTQRQTVHSWVKRYRATRRPEALAEGVHSGRPPRLSPAERERLRLLLEQPPTSAGYPDEQWSLALLQAHLRRAGGVQVSLSTLRRVLRSYGVHLPGAAQRQRQ